MTDGEASYPCLRIVTAVNGMRRLHELITSKGVKHTYVETPGAHHDYQICRVYLADNLQKLF